MIPLLAAATSRMTGCLLSKTGTTDPIHRGTVRSSNHMSTHAVRFSSEACGHEAVSELSGTCFHGTTVLMVRHGPKRPSSNLSLRSRDSFVQGRLRTSNASWLETHMKQEHELFRGLRAAQDE